MSRFSSLPPEILSMILPRLDIASVEAVERTCRALHQSVQTLDRIWQRLYAEYTHNDIDRGEDREWREQTVRYLVDRLAVRSVWLRLLGRRARLDRCWRASDTASHCQLTARLQCTLPLKRPPEVRLYTRPGATLVTNGRRTCLVHHNRLDGTARQALQWLDVSTSSEKIDTDSQLGVECDPSAMTVRAAVLTRKYVAVKIAALQGGHGRLRVWQVDSGQLILDRATWGFYHELEIRKRWLVYFEDRGVRENGRDRLVVVDLAAIDGPRVFRLTSPAAALEGHLQCATATSADFLHSYYVGRTHRWRCYTLTADAEEGKLTRDAAFPATHIYPGHASCCRVESDESCVLVFGRGDYRQEWATWIAKCNLSNDTVCWQQNVGYIPTDTLGLVQTGGGRLLWPCGDKGAKILCLETGEVLHSIQIDGCYVLSRPLLLQPVIGTLVLVGMMPGEEQSAVQRDRCLMLDTWTGEVWSGPSTVHMRTSRRAAVAATANGIARWDGNTLELAHFACHDTLHRTAPGLQENGRKREFPFSTDDNNNRNQLMRSDKRKQRC